MAYFDKFKVTRSNGETVKEGDEIMVDNTMPATFLGISAEPWGDDETGEWFHGRIKVRYSWGSVDEIDDVRAYLMVDEKA